MGPRRSGQELGSAPPAGFTGGSRSVATAGKPIQESGTFSESGRNPGQESGTFIVPLGPEKDNATHLTIQRFLNELYPVTFSGPEEKRSSRHPRPGSRDADRRW